VGFLKDRSDGKEIDHENDPTKREEDYEKMYMKIGRDFLHKDDFARMMNDFIADLSLFLPLLAGLTELNLDFESNSSAMARAREYKMLLESSRDNAKIYKDLINLDEDED
jgi:hypothetical protein